MSRIGLVVLAILLFVGSLERPSGVSLFCMSGSKWGGKRCDCEPGMINVNGKCSCDYGYSPTSKGCQKCNASTTSGTCTGGRTTCSNELVWNGHLCVFNWKQSNCGTVGYWNGAACSKWAYPIVCEAGYTWSGSACTLFITSFCPGDYYWNGQQCAALVTVPACVSFFSWDAPTNSCVYNGPLKCQSSEAWTGSKCVSKTSQVQCDPGNYFNGVECNSINSTILPVCAAGFFWTGTACKQTTDRACNPSYFYDASADACILKLCKQGDVYSSTTACAPASLINDSASNRTSQGTSSIITPPVGANVSMGGIAIAQPGTVAIAPPGTIVIATANTSRQSSGQPSQPQLIPTNTETRMSPPSTSTLPAPSAGNIRTSMPIGSSAQDVQARGADAIAIGGEGQSAIAIGGSAVGTGAGQNAVPNASEIQRAILSSIFGSG